VSAARRKLGEQIPYSPEAKVSIAVDDTGGELPGSSHEYVRQGKVTSAASLLIP